MASFLWYQDDLKPTETSARSVLFHRPDVHVFISRHDNECDGMAVVDRGQLVLWHDQKDTSLSLGFLDRFAKNDFFPKMIVPLGLVATKEWCIVKSTSGKCTKGRMILKTISSVDMLITTAPTKITFYLPVEEMEQLNQAMKETVGRWPNQRELAYKNK